MAFRNRVGALPSRIVNRLISEIAGFMHKKLWTSSDFSAPSNVQLDDIQNFLKLVGVSEGSTLMVHSSWENLNSGHFKASELIKLLLSLVDNAGTLAMPAFPHYSSQVDNAVFDVKKTPSAGGMLTEVFRRYPGVSRSIHLNQSVCAIGNNADFLLGDPLKSSRLGDRFSPYYRLRDIEDSWIVGLGVGHRLKIATSLHCVESMLCEEYPYYSKLFREEVSYDYTDSSKKKGSHSYQKRSGVLYTPKLAKHFTAEELVEETIKGLEVYAIRARTLIDKSIELGRRGRTMYVWPIPFSWYFSAHRNISPSSEP